MVGGQSLDSFFSFFYVTCLFSPCLVPKLNLVIYILLENYSVSSGVYSILT